MVLNRVYKDFNLDQPSGLQGVLTFKSVGKPGNQFGNDFGSEFMSKNIPKPTRYFGI